MGLKYKLYTFTQHEHKTSQRDPRDDTRRMSQAYLSPHDSNLLMELAPIESRIFLQKKGRRRWNLHESLRRTRFPPSVRNFLIKRTYMKLQRLSEINHHPKNSLFHRWGNREQVTILSSVSLLTLENSRC